MLIEQQRRWKAHVRMMRRGEDENAGAPSSRLTPIINHSWLSLSTTIDFFFSCLFGGFTSLRDNQSIDL
jgi:hypothetical protein